MSKPNISIDEFYIRLYKSVSDAKELLKLPNDWDDNGAKAISKELLDFSISFLGLLVKAANPKDQIYIPTFGIGPEASIDLYWKEKEFTLAINIPQDKEAKITFYGEKGLKKIKGEFEKSRYNFGNLDQDIIEMIAL